MMNILSGSNLDAAHYEVRCPSCNVSFPVGTKTCLHCGRRTAPPGDGPGPSLRANPLDPNGMPVEVMEGEMPDEEVLQPRSPFRLGMTSIWILLALIGSAYRVCSGG